MKFFLPLSLAALFFSLTLFSMDRPLNPLPIPRVPTRHFSEQGFYEGGNNLRVNLEGIRLARHRDKITPEGFERWVVDFSSVGKRELDAAAPRFQLRFFPGEKLRQEDGEEVVRKSPHFVLLFQSIQECYLSQLRLKQLLKHSQLVKDIIVYPQIEQGDMAMELVLNDEVAFEAHQPREHAGRLVIDLKAAEHAAASPLP